MRLRSMRALLTGGAGGIGQAIAAELLDHGATVLLVGRDAASLEIPARQFMHHGDRVATFAADLTDPIQRRRLCEHALHWKTGVNALINNAGICDFQRFERQTPQQIEAAFAVNVEAPMHLCGLLLPHFHRIPAATIVNVGSVFGAIGYPGYAVYSATKFALRGFTEALRRELAHTSIRVRYLAPRGTSTRMNPAPVERMNGQLRVAMDPPAKVAQALRRLIERERAQAVVGWPEAFFVRVNALLPGMVDNAIRKQLPVILRHADENTDAARPSGA